jgi:hypothetical protein
MIMDGALLHLYYNNEWRTESEAKPFILINMINSWLKVYMKEAFLRVATDIGEALDDKKLLKELDAVHKELMKMTKEISKIMFCRKRGPTASESIVTKHPKLFFLLLLASRSNNTFYNENLLPSSSQLNTNKY